jgi:hypothetical protein
MNIQDKLTVENLEIPETVKSGIETVGNTVSSIKEKVSETLSGFSDQAQAGMGASTEFLYSNTIIAKFVFLIFVVIGFLILLNLGIYLISYFSDNGMNPYLINGTISGTTPMIISQDPKSSNSVSILRSNNQSSGIECTWCFWLYISDIGAVQGQYQHIFNKGDNYFSQNNIASVNNSPGVYLGPNTNNLHIIMNTVSVNDMGNDSVDISNIPIRNWFHTAIRIQNKTMDVYINGIIASRINLPNVPKQNYNNVNVCQNGGFSGSLSNLRYYNYGLTVFDLNAIVSNGPNMKLVGDSTTGSNSNYTYLSNLWYSA